MGRKASWESEVAAAFIVVEEGVMTSFTKVTYPGAQTSSSSDMWSQVDVMLVPAGFR